MEYKASFRHILIVLLFLFVSFQSALGGTIYVDANGTGDYPTIQSAVDAATTGDIIIVKPGVYTGSGSWDINLRNKAIVLRSQDPNDLQIVATTIIDCNNQGHYGFVFNSGETSQTIISGLSITNSSGAILCQNQSSPTIKDCNFYGNNGEWVIMCDIGHPVIVNCKIQGNLSGGGVYIMASHPTIVGCSINGNNYYGLAAYNSSPRVINTSITDNVRGILGQRQGFPLPQAPFVAFFENCLIAGNRNTGMFLVATDGGLDMDATIKNCTIANNWGKGITIYSSVRAFLLNSIVAYNRLYSGGYPQIYLENMWGGEASLAISYSNIPSGIANIDLINGASLLWGEGNLESDPNFVNVGYWSDNTLFEGDYHLQSFSGCIDAADNASVPADSEDLDEDLNTTEPIPYDLDEHPRIVDGDCNSSDVVDMGAYEFSYVSLGDFAGGCDVDFADFAVLALAWLTEEGQAGYNSNCDIALPYDGAIDGKDLQVFTENWLLNK